MYNSTHEYEACVLVNGKPVTEVTHNGRTYIEGRKNSIYELRFKNKSSQRILVIPSVDGLNVLDGEPCGKDSNGYVVNAYDEIVIPGWKVDSDTAAKFVFKPQDAARRKDETYSESMGEDPENQGVIGFIIYRERPYVYQPLIKRTFIPERPSPWAGDIKYMSETGGYVYGSVTNCVSDNAVIGSSVSNTMGESSAQASVNVVRSANLGHSEELPDPDEGKSLGTGFGKATEFETVSTHFVRATKDPEMVFTMFYDTLQNLKRMGVPVKLFQRKHRRRPAGPNPFPNSPEVMNGCRPPQGWQK